MPADESRTINVLIGSIDLTRPPNRLASVLGSCVGLAIYDPAIQLAGMAHVLLPDSRGAPFSGLPGKYADWAVPHLALALIERGAGRARLRAKVAGGARMFQQVVSGSPGDVGSMNSTAVKELLARAGIPIVAEDLGGNRGRKIHFDPATTAFIVETLDTATAL